jgi:hypothetical protein
MGAKTFMNIGTIVGLLIISVSIPLIFNKIKPNQWYGFWPPKMFSNKSLPSFKTLTNAVSDRIINMSFIGAII